MTAPAPDVCAGGPEGHDFQPRWEGDDPASWTCAVCLSPRPTPPGPDDGEPTVAERLAELMDGMDHLRESANGFRRQLLADGWSETVAEQLAGGLLAQMIAAAFAGRAS